MKSVIVAATGLAKNHPKTVAVGVILLVGYAFISWRSHESPPSTTEEHICFVGGTKDANRRGDVIFVHGVGGHALKTWQGNNLKFLWPEQLGKRFPDCGIWTIAYNASPSAWFGSTMPITDRSKNLLEQMRLNETELGKKPVVFVGHSLGGIVIKQMLQDAFTKNNSKWEEIGNQTKGVVFLATPHTGSNTAVLLNLLNAVVPAAIRSTVTVSELESNAAALRDLNVWYRNTVPDREIRTNVLYESKPVPGCSELVVDEASSDPGISGVTPIRVESDHLTICKIDTENDLVYRSVVDFVAQNLTPVRLPWVISFSEFVKTFNESRRDAVLLDAFEKDHVGQKLTWTAWVRAVISDKENPAYWISSELDSPARDQVLANCSPRDFKKSTQVGVKVRIEGVLEESTNANGAVLHECRIVEWVEVPSK